jgi:hypothetical protein
MRLIQYQIDEQMLNIAEYKGISMGELPGSFTNGHGNVKGFLGEAIFNKAYPMAENLPTYDYDFIVGNLRVDVKTKGTDTPPNENFWVNVNAANTRQDCDVYVFCWCILIIKKAGCVVGILKRNF